MDILYWTYERSKPEHNIYRSVGRETLRAGYTDPLVKT